MSSQVYSYYCSICAVPWRPIKQNLVCPVCGENTWRNNSRAPIPDAEAVELGGVEAIGGDSPATKASAQAMSSQRLAEIDHQCALMSAFLDTVGPDDFAASLPDRGQSKR